MKSKIILWILVILLALQLVTAIGIRPAKTTVVFENSPDYSGQFSVVNNDYQELTLKISVIGEMSEYVDLKTTELRFREIDEAKKVEFEVHLPSDIQPGISSAEIVVEQKLEGNLENAVSSKVVLKHKIHIEGPYPEKHIKAKLNFHDRGDTIGFVSEVENIGEKNIDSINTIFYVNDKKQDLHTLKTETTSLRKGENKLLKAEISKEVFERGEFEVAAVTLYDDQKIEVVKKMLVGKPEVDITYFDPYFIANRINRYSMDLFNKWNKKVENVYVDVELKKDGESIDEFRTKSISIEGFLTETIQDFFDARDKNPGKYSFDMVVNFWNTYKMEEKTFQSELLTEEDFETFAEKKDIPQREVTTNITEKPDSSLKRNTSLLIIPNTIAIVAAFYLIYRYRRRRQEEIDEDGF